MFHAIWVWLRDVALGSWQDPSGYNFVSGPLADTSIAVGLWIFISKHTCHAHGCYRIGRHPVRGTPYVTCAKHHPDVPGKVSAEHIAQAQQDALAGVSGPQQG